MATTTSSLDTFYRKTRQTLVWMNLAHEPFLVLYTLLPFIMRKDLGASLLHLSILSSLRPILPIFAIYWSTGLSQNERSLRFNLIGAWILARAPFLLVPWIHNPWYLIFSCACYELFNKSGIPALIEILKLNMKSAAMHKIYTICFVVSFLESILLGILLTELLKHSILSWTTCCGIAAVLSLSSVLAQAKLIFPPLQQPLNAKSPKKGLLTPWKEAFSLLQSNPDFARFQKGFMIGGFGLMLAAPSLSIFYVDHLHLLHSEVVIARSILMGMGITGSAYLWKRFLTKQRIDQITKCILLGFFIYLSLLYSSSTHKYLFYISYFIYGITQAGSHLLWNLSGPLFSGQTNSAPFSTVNILMVGIRGCIAPAIGGLLCNYLGPESVLLISACICLIGFFYMTHQTQIIPQIQTTSDHSNPINS